MLKKISNLPFKGTAEQEKQLKYDALHFDLSTDLEITFFNRGHYLQKNNEPILQLADLGICEDALITYAKELIMLCYPSKTIRVQSKFIPKFYDDCSGGYHLNFIVK